MNTSELEIRQSRPADEAAVVALSSRLHEFGPPAWRNAARMADVDRELVRRAVLEPNGERMVLVACTGSEIVGFVHLSVLTDYYATQPHVHISDLVVDAGHEGRGIGRALMEASEGWARENGYSWLTIAVFEGNARAAKIYENAGFGRDMLKMVKPLA